MRYFWYFSSLPAELQRVVALRYNAAGNDAFEVPDRVFEYLNTRATIYIKSLFNRAGRDITRAAGRKCFGTLASWVLALKEPLSAKKMACLVRNCEAMTGFTDSAQTLGSRLLHRAFSEVQAYNLCALLNQASATSNSYRVVVEYAAGDYRVRPLNSVPYLLEEGGRVIAVPSAQSARPLDAVKFYTRRDVVFELPGSCEEFPLRAPVQPSYVRATHANIYWHSSFNAYVFADEFPKDAVGIQGSDEDFEEIYGDDGPLPYHSSGNARAYSVRFHAPFENDPLKNDTLTLGFEAELNIPQRDECIRELHSAIGRVAIFEEDGSLDSSMGFETITGWSTLGTVREWAKRYCAVVSRYDYDVEDAGLHITTSSIPKTHIARVFGFIFADTNRSLVRFIAGRSFNGYARSYKRYVHRDGGSSHTPRAIAADLLARVSNDGFSDMRYLAIHPRSAEEGDSYVGTVEWRLFLATGNSKRMLARLEFVWAVTKFTDPARCNALTTEAFEDALVNDPFIRKHTPNLRKYLATEDRAPALPALRALHSRLVQKETKRSAAA
jgi:hypothetical protein